MTYKGRTRPLTKWTHFFDQIYLLNMPKDVDRLKSSSEELHGYDIYFQKVEAIADENPEDGIKLTLKSVFQNALSNGYRNILVFEDDVKFVHDPTQYMLSALVDIMYNEIEWDMLYLGVNTHNKFDGWVTGSLLRVQEGYGLHAVAYSESGIGKVLKLITDDLSGYVSGKENPAIDVMIAASLQGNGKCFCTYPLLATQRSDYSNIQKKYMDQSYIVERFNKNVAHLILNK